MNVDDLTMHIHKRLTFEVGLRAHVHGKGNSETQHVERDNTTGLFTVG